MAEIGIVASIICVAGAGLRLSFLLNTVGCEIASAGIEIHSISKGVSLFSLMLKQVGQALQDSDSVHSSEALETAQEITRECQMVFDEIQEMLDRLLTRRADGSLNPSLQQRFRWCFKKSRVQYLLAQLESLKLNLLLMLQILQLGKKMILAPKNSDQKEDGGINDEMIAQERAETQNLVIVRYWQISRLDRLYAAAEDEEAEERQNAIQHKSNGTADKPQLAIEAPPEYSTSTALIKLPIVSLGELDSTLNQIRDSPRDMLRVSESVIDPLLNRWTRWQEIRDQQATRPVNRYAPSVHNLYETDEDDPKDYGDYQDREDSIRGYYLEGVTTDWRKPHSAAAKQQAANLRKKYAGFQPSISVDSSDAEDNQGARKPKKPASSRHIIDSSTDTSESEPELLRRRKSKAEGYNQNRSRHPLQNPHRSQLYGNSGDARANPGGRNISSPNDTPQSTPRSSISAPRSPGAHRPMTSPVQNQQNQYHHAYTSPLTPIYSPSPPNPYAQNNPYSANPHLPIQAPSYQGYNNTVQYPPRPMPPQGYRMPKVPVQRPVSRDGKRPRSPTRHSGPSVGSQRSTGDLGVAERNRSRKNLAKGATKGVLGAGALAGFFEALEGLEL